MPDPSGRIILARVVKAYTKRAPNEISLLVGDEITVFDATNASMWFGQLLPRADKKGESEAGKKAGNMEHPTGWFPAQNCVPVGAPPKPNHPSNTTSKGGVRLSMRIDNSTFRNQLTAALGDPGVIIGTPIPGLPSPRLRKHARVLHDYTAESPSELTITTGDILSLLSSNEDESWWEGELASGQIGFFPKDFVQVFRDPTASDGEFSVPVAAANAKKMDVSEFEDPHAIAVIAQVVTAHEPVVPVNDSGTPFLALPEGAVVALLDSNPNHMYWLAVHFNNNHAPLNHSADAPCHAPIVPPSSVRVGLVPKANLAVFEGLAEPQCNYPFKPVPLGIMRILANRAVGSVSSTDGKSAVLARVAFEFMGENENEHEYLGVGDLVWIIDDDEVIRSEAWVEVEIDTKRGFCPTSFLEVLSDRVQAPKPDMIMEYDFGSGPASPHSPHSPTRTASPSKSKDALSRLNDLSAASSSKSEEPSGKKKKKRSETTKDKSSSKSSKSSESKEVKSSETSSKDSKDSKDSKEGETSSSNSQGPYSTSAATLARALYPYNAESNSELTLNVGDIVRLIDYPASEEWWEGVLVASDGSPLPDDYIGFFPRDFVVILAKDPAGDKKKKRPKRGATVSKTKSKKSAVSTSPGDSSEEKTATSASDQPSKGSSRKGERARASTTASAPVTFIAQLPSAAPPPTPVAAASTSSVAHVPVSQASNAAHEKETAELKEQIENLKMEIESLTMDVEMKQAELDTNSAEVGMLQHDLDSKTAECERQTDEMEALKIQLEALQTSYGELERKQTASASKSSKTEQVQTENQTLKAEVAKWKARAEASELAQTKLAEQVKQLTKKLEESHQQAVERAKHHRQQTQQQAEALPKRAPPPLSAPPSAPPSANTHANAHSTTPSTAPATTTATNQAKHSAAAAASPSKPPPATPTAPTAQQPPAVTSSATPASPTTPKARALPPTPAAVPGLPKNNSQPKLAAGAPPKRTLPPAQPAPKLPPEFVKKTAAPTAAYKAASHISAQTAAAGAKKAALTPKTSQGQLNMSSVKSTAASSPAKASTSTIAPKTTAATPKVLDEFEHKRKFFESLK
jgi:hypothetical protein